MFLKVPLIMLDTPNTSNLEVFRINNDPCILEAHFGHLYVHHYTKARSPRFISIVVDGASSTHENAPIQLFILVPCEPSPDRVLPVFAMLPEFGVEVRVARPFTLRGECKDFFSCVIAEGFLRVQLALYSVKGSRYAAATAVTWIVRPKEMKSG